MDAATTVTALKALAHDSRLAAYRALVQAGPDGLSVGELRDQLDLPPATLTAHLNVLRAAGLIADTREGRVIRMRADYARMNALRRSFAEAAEFEEVPCVVPAVRPPQRHTGSGAARRQ